LGLRFLLCCFIEPVEDYWSCLRKCDIIIVFKKIKFFMEVFMKLLEIKGICGNIKEELFKRVECDMN